MTYCSECFEKQKVIDRLCEENKRLKAKLRYREHKEHQGYFGSSTPSSQRPFKENKRAGEEKRGGAKLGHKGNGRKKADSLSASSVEHLSIDDNCPFCGTMLEKKGTRDRTVVESKPVKAEKILNICEKGWCPKCRKSIEAKPSVLPKGLYGNRLLSNVIVMHYYHGLPMGRIEEVIGEHVITGSLFKTLHRVATIFKPALEKIIEEYREEQVRHADETGWRNDGENGYCWIFCTKFTTIFQFKDTRSSSAAKKIFGEMSLEGFLVVDRYAGYNRIKCKIQYCYAHLLRTVEDLGKQFIDELEVQNFVGSLAPVLSEAMHLHSKKISDKQYYKKAKMIKDNIQQVINADAIHLGVRNIQDIFRENEKRLYHWVDNRDVPADNNRAERELRPTVIARKVSFGSQSTQGAKMREIIMTIIHTAKKRLSSQTLEEWLKKSLDKISANPKIDPYFLIPPIPI